jgi:enediyne biosynthesis protein E4
MISTRWPCLCKADLNKDGLEDVYIGGAKDQEGYLALQNASGTFDRIDFEVFEKDKGSEDVDCAFFDANGDGFLDLYVVSGGNEFEVGAPRLGDRLYISNPQLSFSKSKQILPVDKFESTSVVAPADYDGDGDIDLFVGGRIQTYSYGFPRNGYILNNDGVGNYTNVADEIAQELAQIGMITDAKWVDLDQDLDLDLVLVNGCPLLF